MGSAIGKGFKKAGTAIGGAFAHPLKTLSRFDSAVGKVKVGSTLGEAIGFAGGALTGDDFVSGFMHDSGIKKKPDPAKETAANTAATNKQLKEWLDNKLNKDIKLGWRHTLANQRT